MDNNSVSKGNIIAIGAHNALKDHNIHHTNCRVTKRQ